MTNLTFLPKDLNPAQRAGLKLASHFILIGIFNALLAGYVWLADGNAFSWRGVALVVAAQAALAILDAGKKYVTAQGDIPFSALIELARLQLAQRAPQPIYTPAQATLKQDLNTVLTPSAATAQAASSVNEALSTVNNAASVFQNMLNQPDPDITAPRPIVKP